MKNKDIVDKTILIITGMRKCKLLGLHLDDIDLSDGIITISRNLNWNKFINKHNLKYITLYGLRHSYCSMQINENKNLTISMISKLMGHSQLFTTLKYLHSNK